MVDGVRNFFEQLFFTARKTKLAVLLSIDIVTVVSVNVLAVFHTQSGTLPLQEQGVLIAFMVMLRVAGFYVFDVYSTSWRFASSREFKRLYGVIVGGSLCFALLVMAGNIGGITHFSLMPFVILECMAVLTLIFTIRGILRMLRDELLIQTKKKSPRQRTPIIIIGAGSAGAMLASENRKNPNLSYDIKGFLDDDNTKINQQIHGVRVLGKIATLKKHLTTFGINDVVIAIPSLSSTRLREIIQEFHTSSIRFKITPSLHGIIDGKVSLSELREIRIQDLLGRTEVDHMIISKEKNYITNTCVLVTGGGGSIGSEICIQLLNFQPKTLIIVDNCEDNVYQIDRKIKRFFPQFNGVVCIVADVACKEDMTRIFSEYTIDTVFHAAAYKHVPLMEENVPALLKNNVEGTHHVLALSAQYAVSRFILISTDKAVNPANSMGASKRICELLTLSYAKTYQANMSVVRFGNVLASKGSVIPLFKEQIAQGGPLTVTHPDITRYFMTIPEASRLVLQSGVLSKGGEVFTLDMGKPIKIVDLANDMIRLSGSASDIPITFTGLRPGEKMYEELSYNEATIKKTIHPKKIGRAHV